MKKLLSLTASVLGDARFALRLLARSPGYALTLLGVLALGIGATTAMFSIASALLLRPLPYRDADQLTMIWKTHEPLAREWPASIPDFVDYHDRNKTFSKMAAATHDSFSLASDGARAEYVGGVDVTGEFFEVFGVQAVHGRLLGPADDKVGGPPVCVVSADLWRRRFAGDPSLVGRTITLSGRPFTVVGVVQDGFRMGGPYGDRIDVWAPLAVHPTYPEKAQSRGNNHLWVMGRRKPGVSLAEAQADMSAIAAALAAEYPRSRRAGRPHRDQQGDSAGRERAIVGTPSNSGPDHRTADRPRTTTAGVGTRCYPRRMSPPHSTEQSDVWGDRITRRALSSRVLAPSTLRGFPGPRFTGRC